PTVERLLDSEKEAESASQKRIEEQSFDDLLIDQLVGRLVESLDPCVPEDDQNGCERDRERLYHGIPRIERTGPSPIRCRSMLIESINAFISLSGILIACPMPPCRNCS